MTAEFCVAVYDFTATKRDGLSFAKGARIEVLQRPDDGSGWWRGLLVPDSHAEDDEQQQQQQQSGYFPGQYVRLLDANGEIALPDGWKAYTTPEGRAYYVHLATKERSWKAPEYVPGPAAAAAAAAAAVSETAATTTPPAAAARPLGPAPSAPAPAAPLNATANAAVATASSPSKPPPAKPAKPAVSAPQVNHHETAPAAANAAAAAYQDKIRSQLQGHLANQHKQAISRGSSQENLSADVAQDEDDPYEEYDYPASSAPTSGHSSPPPPTSQNTTDAEQPGMRRQNSAPMTRMSYNEDDYDISKFDAKALVASANAEFEAEVNEPLDPNKIGFVDHFWGEDDKGNLGFDLLVLKHRNGKEVCKDMAEFMRERAAIEDQYAKQLARLAKTSLGDQEEGSLKTAWNQVKMDMLNQSQAHQSFAGALVTDLDKSIMKFKDGAKKQRKAYEVTLSQDRKALADRVPNVDRAKRNFFDKCKELEQASTKEDRGQLDHMTKKDFLKVQEDARRMRQRAEVAADEYRRAVDEYNKAHKRLEDDMIHGCMDFEEAELERVGFLKEQLIKYINLKRQVNESSSQSLAFAAESVTAAEARVDIEYFVRAKGTNQPRPRGLKMESYPPPTEGLERSRSFARPSGGTIRRKPAALNDAQN
ncbi:hypothetical protein CAOG_05459 [Capsaspora owczarzaki ATCC 30864]|uniref:Uncharacterized protein n=1 Tax=Capsaspora owczarzaki (strain ATCC 30864) TaxID=595528 RepID=A0A0D2WTE8_CAPO3|nr:hypothetical protein CAOG_05459 [Capsaspora owczarzaki ATCC 30864]KJE94918.1 hypothetical protein, variant [Capsaspora owczarzaki ATCC 30864]|eukprot:XP_004346132.1 hypothetical protein CAOG_05459 [Capsaspora owczarzaki ATCC 30864]